MAQIEGRELEVTIRIGRLFQRMRSNLGLSLKQVETATGISAAQIHRLETGFIAKPSFADVVTLANFYRVPIQDLLVEVGLDHRQRPEEVAREEGPLQAQVMTLIQAILKQANEEQLNYLIGYLKIYLKYLSEQREV